MLLEQIKESLNNYSYEELISMYQDGKRFYEMNLEIFKQYAYVIASDVQQLLFHKDMTYNEIMEYLPEDDKFKLEQIRQNLINEIAEKVFIRETKQQNKEIN